MLQSEGEIGSGPHVGRVATYPMPPMGSPKLECGGENGKWRTKGPGGSISPTA